MPLDLSAADFRAFAKIPESEGDAFLESFIQPAIAVIEKMIGRPAASIDSEEANLALKIQATYFYQSRDFPSEAVAMAVRNQVLRLISGAISIPDTLIYSQPDDDSSGETESVPGTIGEIRRSLKI